MFCYQCQEAAGNKGCTSAGVCGKNNEVATLQDLLIYLAKGIAFWRVKASSEMPGNKDADFFVIEALFTTITNVSFSEKRSF